MLTGWRAKKELYVLDLQLPENLKLFLNEMLILKSKEKDFSIVLIESS